VSASTRGGDVGSRREWGHRVQSVLGLSLTSTSVGWVLLDRQGPEAATLDDDAFDIQPGTDGNAGETSPHAAAARGAHAIATASGHKVGSVHVTWTDGVEAEAAALLKSLADLGFEHIHPIPLSRAARAWGIEAGRAIEHSKTAVCILEPGAATIMVVATGAGTVRTAVTDVRESPEDLVEWLRTVFRKDGWLPESLYLVGALADLDDVTEPVGAALPIPVSSSVDTQLALARGAALASTDAPQAVEGPPERIAVREKPPAPAEAETVVAPPVDEVTAVISTVAGAPHTETVQRERPWLAMHAKKLAISAAAVAVFGAALSLTAGSALNIETASTQAAGAVDPGSSAPTASVHPSPAPPAQPAAQLQPLAAEPPPPPQPVELPAEPAAAVAPEAVPAAVMPEPVAVPVPHLPVAASSPVAVPVAAPVAAPPLAPVAAAPPAAPALVAPPPAAPALVAPPPAAPALVAPPPAAPAPGVPAPIAPPSAGPIAPPAAGEVPPSDPIQAALSPLFSGLP
jgi:hypothetical protein